MDFNPDLTSKQLEQQFSSVEQLNSALKSNIVPNQEYLLQGSIQDSSVDILIHRLRGLCDNMDAGPDTFHDHEVCFVLVTNPAHGPPALTLRVRRAMDDPTTAWHLRYLGQPELGDKNRPTLVRSILDIACGSEVAEFLKELGCRREFDYITKGYLFRKGRIKITVGKIYRFDAKSLQDNLEPITGSHYVEMSVVCPAGQDVVGEDMKALAEQLKPLVMLDKVDARR